jgi:hypothetical protein
VCFAWMRYFCHLFEYRLVYIFILRIRTQMKHQ